MISHAAIVRAGPGRSAGAARGFLGLGGAAPGEPWPGRRGTGGAMMGRMATRLRPLAASALTLMLLGGCSALLPGGPSAGPSGASAGPSAGAPAGPSTSDPANPPTLPPETPPGKRLKLGAPLYAKVPMGGAPPGTAWALVGIIVDTIQPGDQTLWPKIAAPGPFAGGTLYYLHGHMKVVALYGPAGAIDGAVSGLQNDNKVTGTTSNPGALTAECSGGFVIERPTVGLEAETCAIALATKGASVVGAVFFRDRATTADAAADPYRKQPVAWLA